MWMKELLLVKLPKLLTLYLNLKGFCFHYNNNLTIEVCMRRKRQKHWLNQQVVYCHCSHFICQLDKPTGYVAGNLGLGLSARSKMNSKALVALLCVILGCCASVVFLELLVVADPGSGNLITFCQFVVISIEGFFTTMRCGTRKLAVPIREYIVLVVLFFMVSTMNNMAFNFNISMTLHLIFRAGSLMTSMVLGVFIMNKKYTLTKYASVVTISIGIAVCTIASAKDVKTSQALGGESGFSEYFWWVVGITILTLALFMSARMGLYQEVMYRKYGKHPREALFFTHFLPLPGFALLLSDLVTHIEVANKSVPVQVFGVAMPAIWLYITCNVLTQCVCINSVFVLTTECTSLTVTLVITLRKFLSLVFSIFYFNNPFTFQHWLGTILVFMGTFLYSDIPSMLRQRSSGDKQKIT